MAPEETRRVLVVDDDPAVRAAHSRYVESLGYEVEAATDGFEALTKLALGIDMVLLDIHMPNMDGFAVAQQIRAHPEHGLVPIIMVTGLDRESWYPRALEVGANDVISKPINADELRLRTRWLMELKTANDRLKVANAQLSSRVNRGTDELRKAFEQVGEAHRRIHDAHLDTIRRLTIAAEFKDQATAGHIARVGLCAAILAKAVNLSPRITELIQQAAPMHDVGKIGIPDAVLLKPGPLDDVERALAREHTRIGASLLAGSDSDVIQMGAMIALCHHERWDGRGYPHGLTGEKVPIEARVCAVVDFFDACTMDRPYRKAIRTDQALTMIGDLAGTHFEPALVNAFFGCLPQFAKIREEHPVQ